jgi:hypothetical protein
MKIVATNFRPLPKATLRGFVALALDPSGLVIKDCTVHRRDDGCEWIDMPGKPQLDQEGRQCRDEAGKALYTNLIDFADKAAGERFQAAAIEALKVLRGSTAP